MKEKNAEITEIFTVLLELDVKSLLLVKAGAEMLKARQEMDKLQDETATATALSLYGTLTYICK